MQWSHCIPLWTDELGLLLLDTDWPIRRPPSTSDRRWANRSSGFEPCRLPIGGEGGVVCRGDGCRGDGCRGDGCRGDGCRGGLLGCCWFMPILLRSLWSASGPLDWAGSGCELGWDVLEEEACPKVIRERRDHGCEFLWKRVSPNTTYHSTTTSLIKG